MANNIRDLRIALLLSPTELARRIGIYPEYIARLESGARPLSAIWIDAVARALCVPREIVTDRTVDFDAIAASAPVLPERSYGLCPVGARYAIKALAAKVGGVKLAAELSEDELADAVQSLVSYVEDDDEALFESERAVSARANRLSKGLQITALTILQSRAPDLQTHALSTFETVLPGAVSLLETFSQVDRARARPEK